MLLEIAKRSALWFEYSNSIFSSSASSDSQLFKYGNISEWLSWKTKRETENDCHPKCLIANIFIIVNLWSTPILKVKCHLWLKKKGVKPLIKQQLSQGSSNNNYTCYKLSTRVFPLLFFFLFFFKVFLIWKGIKN